jgi:hypothetical protein
MVVLIAGMSGPLLRWTCDVVAFAASLAERVAVCEPIVADGTWMQPEEEAADRLRLFVADHPNEFAMAAVRDGRLRALLVLDDPAWSLREWRDAGVAFDAVLRSLSASVTVVGEMVAASGTALMLVRSRDQDIMTVLDDVLTYVRLALRPADVAVLAVRFGSAWMEMMSARADLTAEDAAMIDAVLRPACHYAITGERRPVVWPRACLFWGDRPGEPAPRVIDLTGPSRVLVYGPYLRLPAGRWSARAVLAFSPQCAGTPFTVELHGSARFGHCRFVVAQAGVFAVTFPVTVPSAREALEMRLVSQRGAIEGILGLEGIAFTPV